MLHIKSKTNNVLNDATFFDMKKPMKKKQSVLRSFLSSISRSNKFLYLLYNLLRAIPCAAKVFSFTKRRNLWRHVITNISMLTVDKYSINMSYDIPVSICETFPCIFIYISIQWEFVLNFFSCTYFQQQIHNITEAC